MEKGTEEEAYYKERHLDENTFEEGGWRGGEGGSNDGGREGWVEGDEVRVVVVKIRDGRVSDWKGAVREFSMEEEEQGTTRLVNGVS